jgi:hypothetical protein
LWPYRAPAGFPWRPYRASYGGKLAATGGYYALVPDVRLNRLFDIGGPGVDSRDPGDAEDSVSNRGNASSLGVPTRADDSRRRQLTGDRARVY